VPPCDDARLWRILDANRNRCLEGLRVVEDHVRFAREDRHLTAQCKQLRHDVVQTLATLLPAALHAARETAHDVGCTVETDAEYTRADLHAVLGANWQRVHQALRSLEEHAKVISPGLSRQLETLRYRAYSLERALTILHDSAQRLAGAQLYVLIDGGSSADAFGQLVEQLCVGGADVLQLRDKGLPDRVLLERARLLRELTRRHGVLFVMNDRVDLALLAEADGVHLGQDEVAAQDARRVLGCHALIGISTHSIEQARQAVLAGANYLGCGPTFASRTKAFAHFPGVPFLRQVADDIQLPAFAIGGVELGNVAQVVAAGFARVAVSQAVVADPEPARAARQLRAALGPVAAPTQPSDQMPAPHAPEGARGD
jgi:thiamine-phosphate pyrophosphorylase